MTRDANGEIVTKSVRREPLGLWGATVWFGSHYVTNVARYYYRTRTQARHADISDAPGDRSGRVCP